jgi:hypothetical protein
MRIAGREWGVGERGKGKGERDDLESIFEKH